MNERAKTSRAGYRDGFLWDRSGQRWRRVADWLEPHEAAQIISEGAGWLLEPCSGGRAAVLTWPEELAADALAADILPRMMSGRRASRMRRKRSVPTVLVAEQWQDDQARSLVVFVEQGPYPRTEKMLS